MCDLMSGVYLSFFFFFFFFFCAWLHNEGYQVRFLTRTLRNKNILNLHPRTQTRACPHARANTHTHTHVHAYAEKKYIHTDAHISSITWWEKIDFSIKSRWKHLFPLVKQQWVCSVLRWVTRYSKSMVFSRWVPSKVLEAAWGQRARQ